MRYWYLDSENYTTLMLLDKGYYDYDYEEAKSKPKYTGAKHEPSKERTDYLMKRFSFGRYAEKEKLTPEELQAEIMAERT